MSVRVLLERNILHLCWDFNETLIKYLLDNQIQDGFQSKRTFVNTNFSTVEPILQMLSSGLMWYLSFNRSL